MKCKAAKRAFGNILNSLKKSIKKKRNKLVKFGITTATLSMFVFVIYMLINLIFNYILIVIKIMPAILKKRKLPSLQFQFNYLFCSHLKIPTMLVFAAAVIIAAFYCRKPIIQVSNKIYSLFPFAKPTVDGKQRWATNREIKKMLKAIDRDDTNPEYAGLVLATDENRIFVERKNVHTFVIGTTGAGKSQTLVLPSIHAIIICKRPESMIINDVKGELFENTYYDLVKKGYDYYVLNFHEPARGAQWNPLQPIIDAYVKVADANKKDFSKAIELANELAAVLTDNPKSDPVWPQSAKSLLVAMIIYLTEDGYKRKCLEKLNLYSIYNFFVEFGGKEFKSGLRSINALDQIMSSLPVGHPAKMAYATSKFAVGEMRSSIFATLASNLQIFADSGIAYMTGKNDIDFRKLVDPARPCAIYMLLPENKPTRYVLSTLFITQCYSALVDIAEEYPHRVLPQRVHFIIDELGITPRIPGLNNKTSAGRSMGIIFDLFVQSMAQLEGTYGKHAAATIQNNCGNWVYLNSMDRDTNKYVSDLLGNGTLEYSTYNAENGDFVDRTKMNHTKANPLMRPEDLPQMPEGDAVVIKQRSFPIHTTLTHYYKLGLPVADIKKVLPLKEIDLDKLLYPVGSIKVPGFPNLTKPDTPQEKQNYDHVKTLGIINNMNILTNNEFGTAIKNHNFAAAWQMINKNLEEDRISEDQVGTLQSYIDELSSKQ